MNTNNKGYQLGNYIKDWGNRIVKITGIKPDNVDVEYPGEIRDTLSWYDVSPVDLKVDILKGMGFYLINEKRNPYHVQYSMSIILNGKYYNAIGIEYEDRSLWHFSNTSILYVHQLQNLLYIVCPSKDHQDLRTPLSSSVSTIP